MPERLCAAAACVAALLATFCVADLFVKATARSPSAAPAGGAAGRQAGAGGAPTLVGVWEVLKSDEVPPGTTIEFTRDGKLRMTANVQGKEVSQEGTYTVQGDKFTTVGTVAGKEHRETVTIQTLTPTTLVTRDEKGKVDEFRRKQ